MSKSGSKALSKSVDSVVKSVESVVSSVLPKNMNMKHVLLAILVGLLLCMLMGNTVEGFGPSGAPGGDYTSPSLGYCYNYTGNKGTQKKCVPKGGSAPTTVTTGEFCKGPGENGEYTKLPAGGTCPANTTAVTGNTMPFCAAFNNFTGSRNSDGLGCEISGVEKYCKSALGEEEAVIDCTTDDLDDKKCPKSKNYDDSFTQKDYLPGQLENCRWQDCSGFATKRDEVVSAFSAPGLDPNKSIKNWAKCIENGPDKWTNMKTDSLSNNVDAWDGGDSWAIGSPTGQTYAHTTDGNGDAQQDGGVTVPPSGGRGDLSILKPLIYKDKNTGSKVTAFARSDATESESLAMFPSEFWKTELDKKIKFCGAPATQNLEDKDYSTDDALNDGAVIGWDHSKSKFICLNNNPAVYTEVTQKRAEVVKAPGCGSPGVGECTQENYCDGKCACEVDEDGPTDSALEVWNNNCPDSNQAEVVTTQIAREINGATNVVRNNVSGGLMELARFIS